VSALCRKDSPCPPTPKDQLATSAREREREREKERERERRSVLKADFMTHVTAMLLPQ